jgi:hypothetical protein
VVTTALVVSLPQVKEELKRLRQGQGLAHPAAVLGLSPQLRAAISRDLGADPADDVVRLVAAIRCAIEDLGEHERLYAQVDFNLTADHTYPTLSARQESLASVLRCTSKTVRRHADKALDTLALILVTTQHNLLAAATGARDERPTRPREPAESAHEEKWHDHLRDFWGLSADSRVDIVCSEIPEDERPYFASPQDRNYLRYAKFADLDSLIYVRTRISQLFPSVAVRDFSPSEYFGADTDALIVIGGPPWNAKYREFMPQLPFYFESHPLGEDDPLIVPLLGNLSLGPCWTPDSELLQDVAVFTRLTLAQGTRVFLLAGCLTLGVLGAAKCFLQGSRGADNARYMSENVGDQDFVLISEVRRIGGIADMADLTSSKPLGLLVRRANDPFTVVSHNKDRYRTR